MVAKPPDKEFETVVNRLLRMPHKDQADSKVGKRKEKAKAPTKRTTGKGRTRVGKARS